MYKITANDWEGMKCNKIKFSVRNTRVNNAKMMEVAEKYAIKNRNSPSPLEKMMLEFLKAHNVKFEFQKPCCIYKDEVITQFFVLDFYIPSCKVIIETDGKFHDSQEKYDEYRTKMIKKQYPKIKLLRWKYSDFRSVYKMEELLKQLQ